MKKLIRVLSTIAICAGLVISAGAQAAKFSSTKAELLRGFDYKRGPNGAEVNQTILTLANVSGFTWGDSYFFADITNIEERDNTGGTHLEFGPRLSLLRAFGDAQWKGAIKDIYLIVQGDFTSNAFISKWVSMGGVSADWNVPGFRFVKTHIQYRDDPTKSGSSVQFNLVWNSGFKAGGQQFSFEGFLDWTSPEGDGFSRHGSVLWQPQLLWHINKSIAVGGEYQYWKNRIGIKDRNERAPQAMVRWTF